MPLNTVLAQSLCFNYYLLNGKKGNSTLDIKSEGTRQVLRSTRKPGVRSLASLGLQPKRRLAAAPRKAGWLLAHLVLRH